MTITVQPTTTRAPRLTIGLPVFNSEGYLREALDSLLSQTFRDFELVISDNGSTDGTADICREYAECDARIRFHREETNRGASWNFNRVLKLATGEYFKWAAHDDYCAPTFLERCIDVLDADTSVVCCHAKTQKVNAHGQPLPLPDPTEAGGRRRWTSRPLNASGKRAHQRFHDVLLSSGWAVRCYGIMRTDAIRQTGLLLPVYGYEKVMMAELSLLGRFHDIQETLFFQRVHTEASSHLASASEQQSFFAADGDEHVFPRLEYLRGYKQALRRMPISVLDRVLGMMWIARYLLQVTKWKSVILSSVRGTGTGGAARSVVSRKKRQSDPDPTSERLT